MKDHSPHLRIIGQLAQEYEQKFEELRALISQTPQENVLLQLRALAERTTDKFRGAQVALLSSSALSEGKEAEGAVLATTAMCRAFDEMRILFQFLSENFPGPSEKTD